MIFNKIDLTKDYCFKTSPDRVLIFKNTEQEGRLVIKFLKGEKAMIGFCRNWDKRQSWANKKKEK